MRRSHIGPNPTASVAFLAADFAILMADRPFSAREHNWLPFYVEFMLPQYNDRRGLGMLDKALYFDVCVKGVRSRAAL